ncbi:terminase small subunit [Patescibacteria group bacterium]|nr:terminase small subunit [Patescibacteria group bacterium]
MNKLTKKQENFCVEYLETGNATEAAERSYSVKNRQTANAVGAENLAKPSIRAYLDRIAKSAVIVIYELSQSAINEAVRLSASKDILDRAGYRVQEKSAETNNNIIVTIDPIIASKNGIDVNRK